MTEQASTEEVHISSLVVLCKPDYLDDAGDVIQREQLAEIHASDPSGKMVVVLETADESRILDTINQIEAIDGVVSATLVYHQID